MTNLVMNGVVAEIAAVESKLQAPGGNQAMRKMPLWAGKPRILQTKSGNALRIPRAAMMNGFDLLEKV